MLDLYSTTDLYPQPLPFHLYKMLQRGESVQTGQLFARRWRGVKLMLAFNKFSVFVRLKIDETVPVLPHGKCPGIYLKMFLFYLYYI